GYPGGPVIDNLATLYRRDGEPGAGGVPRFARDDNPNRIVSAQARPSEPIRFGEVKIKGSPYDFSFSGIKTAVLYYLRKHTEFEPEIAARREALARGERKAAQLLPLCSAETLDLIAKFQRIVVTELVGRTLRAAEETNARS